MRTVVVYSTKGGVGKTTAAVNLAWEAALTHRVLLWDLDPQGAATFLLGVKPKLKGGVDALVSGKTEVGEVVRQSNYPRLDVLPADDSYRDLDLVFDAAKKSTQRIAKVLNTVAKDYDVVILDCPPGSSLIAENALHAADSIVVPLVPSPLSLRSLEQVNRIVAEAAKSTPIIAFFSMVDRRKTAHRLAVESLPGEQSTVTAIVVPSTIYLERMGTERAPVATFAPRTEAAQAFVELWATVKSAAKLKDAVKLNNAPKLKDARDPRVAVAGKSAPKNAAAGKDAVVGTSEPKGAAESDAATPKVAPKTKTALAAKTADTTKNVEPTTKKLRQRAGK